MLSKAIKDIRLEALRDHKTEEEAQTAVDEDEMVAAMAGYFLAAPGLISTEVRDAVHQELLVRGFLQPAGHGGRFTWDGSENAITISPLWAKSYTWIDYVLWVQGSSRPPSYMDNRVIRLTAKASFPELAHALTRGCNETSGFAAMAAAVSDRLGLSAYGATRRALGIRREALIKTGLCNLKKMPCRNPSGDENVTDYGMLLRRLGKSIDEKMVDNSQLLGPALVASLREFGRDEDEFDRRLPSIDEIMDPLLAPLLLEASDHYAVLSHIVFSTATSGKRAFFDARTDARTPTRMPARIPARTLDSFYYEPLTTLYTESPWGSVGGDWEVSAAGKVPNAIRILSQNMHFRPYDIRPVGSLAHSPCNTKYMAMNMQEFRAKVFVKALAELDTTAEFPHVICLQETQHVEANNILTERMAKQFPKLKCVTSQGKRVRSLFGRRDTAKGAGIWSGLQVWTSYNIVDCIFDRFTDSIFQSASKIAIKEAGDFAGTFIPEKTKAVLRDAVGRFMSRKAIPHVEGVPSAGADKLAVNKGMLYVLLQDPASKRHIGVIVTHPSPYVELAVPGLDSTPEQVAEIHRLQIILLGKFVRSIRLEMAMDRGEEFASNCPLFVTGDLNINKYAVKPDSFEEKDVALAQAGRSREFNSVLEQLNAVAPAFVADTNTKRWVPINKIDAACFVEDVLLGNVTTSPSVKAAMRNTEPKVLRTKTAGPKRQ